MSTAIFTNELLHSTVALICRSMLVGILLSGALSVMGREICDNEIHDDGDGT